MSKREETSEKPKQIEPLLDPNEPEGTARYPYYLLEKMHSPPVAPPNSIGWKAYPQPVSYLRGDDPHDTRVAYGFIEYDRRLSWEDLYTYNMLPMDYDEGVVFDLWVMFGKSKAALLAFFTLFFKVVKDDPALRRLNLAIKLVSRGWTIKKARQEVAKIDDKT